MDIFFQTIRDLPAGGESWTVTGIDGLVAGEKAVIHEGTICYHSSGLSKEVLQDICFPKKSKRLEISGGSVFLEKLGSIKKIILCGGGHVSSATLSIARLMDFHITVVEDRPSFAQTAKSLGADEVICDDFTNALKQLNTDKDTYVVIMTRGHRHDLDCLRVMLNKEYAYLGMMGSQGRVKRIKEQFLAEGFNQQQMVGLHSPVGIAIGAITPAEIAVSVMAEVIQVKNAVNRQTGYEKELSDWLFLEQQKKPAVLAQIVERKGSAPREVGTKMVIFKDGSTIGTIGGGCMEAAVCRHARHLLEKNGKKKWDTCFVDMTTQDAQEEGMVCGGTILVFLETLAWSKEKPRNV